MPHRLHLVRAPGDSVAHDVIREQCREPGTRVSVVLMPGAALPVDHGPAELYRLVEGGAGEGGDGHPITAEQLLELIFEADAVVTW